MIAMIVTVAIYIPSFNENIGLFIGIRWIPEKFKTFDRSLSNFYRIISKNVLVL